MWLSCYFNVDEKVGTFNHRPSMPAESWKQEMSPRKRVAGGRDNVSFVSVQLPIEMYRKTVKNSTFFKNDQFIEAKCVLEHF